MLNVTLARKEQIQNYYEKVLDEHQSYNNVIGCNCFMPDVCHAENIRSSYVE